MFGFSPTATLANAFSFLSFLLSRKLGEEARGEEEMG